MTQFSRPNFFLLGAAKCGTTALSYYLSQHPQVFISEPKEPKFFESEYEKGLDYYWDTYFADWSGEAAVGDCRVVHLFLPYVVERIHGAAPEAKLLVSLRDPVERAYSLWWELHCNGLEELDFRAALEENKKRLEMGMEFDQETWLGDPRPFFGSSHRHRIYLDQGHYAEQLERYLNFFPMERFKFVFQPELEANSQAVVSDVFDFLAVDSDFTLVDDSPRRRARVKGEGRVRRWTRGVPGALAEPMLRLVGRFGRRPTLDADLAKELREHYRGHDRKLSRLLGRELPWRID